MCAMWAAIGAAGPLGVQPAAPDRIDHRTMTEKLQVK